MLSSVAAEPPSASASAGMAILPPKVQETLRRLGPLAVNPDAVARLLQETGGDPAAVTATISTCPALSARILSVVSSTAFGVSWRVASVVHTIGLLGPKRARATALAYALRNLARPNAIAGKELYGQWAAAIRKAVAARLFCEPLAPESADAAYALGLIQDIGIPMLMAADPDFYLNNPSLCWPDGGAAVERSHFGLPHGAVAQELLLSWNAGERLQQIILSHHRPPPPDAEPLLYACYTASLLPHLDGPMDLDANAQLAELHERFLADHYASPDAFMLAVAEQSQRILEPRSQANVPDRALLMSRLISAVTNEAITAQTRLCKVEQAYRGQRENFTSLREQAYTDPLTRLLNRRGFMELADRRIQSQQATGRGLCCMVFDLDGLKTINDQHGHETGDAMLRGFAKLLRRYLDEDDLIARFGGDEYAAMIMGVDEATSLKVAERVVRQIHSSRLRLKPDLEMDVSCSVGAVYYDRGAGQADIESVLSQADHVMYQRKHSGKAGLVFQPYMPGANLESSDSRIGQAQIVPPGPQAA